MPQDQKIETSEPLHIIEVNFDEARDFYEAKTDGTPKKLSTNREAQGRELGRFKNDGTLITVSYVHRRKEMDDGRVFNNYYYYGGTPVAASNGHDADDGITRVRSTAAEKTPAEAWRIALSVGTERAVQLAPHMEGKKGFIEIWALGYEFAKRIFLTPPPKADELDPLPVGGGRGAYDESGAIGDDDDIPF
jgi:hypothetical protein